MNKRKPITLADMGDYAESFPVIITYAQCAKVCRSHDIDFHENRDNLILDCGKNGEIDSLSFLLWLGY